MWEVTKYKYKYKILDFYWAQEHFSGIFTYLSIYFSDNFLRFLAKFKDIYLYLLLLKFSQ